MNDTEREVKRAYDDLMGRLETMRDRAEDYERELIRTMRGMGLVPVEYGQAKALRAAVWLVQRAYIASLLGHPDRARARVESAYQTLVEAGIS